MEAGRTATVRPVGSSVTGAGSVSECANVAEIAGEEEGLRGICRAGAPPEGPLVHGGDGMSALEYTFYCCDCRAAMDLVPGKRCALGGVVWSVRVRKTT